MGPWVAELIINILRKFAFKHNNINKAAELIVKLTNLSSDRMKHWLMRYLYC